MKKAKFLLVIIVLTIIAASLSGCNVDKGLASRARKNKEMVAYIPILKEDFPLIKEKLEILRMGEVGKGGYYLNLRSPEYADIYIYIYNEDKGELELTPLSENKYNLPAEEIQAIEYLFLSENLQKNTTRISFEGASWDLGLGAPGADFASTENSHFHIGLFYFENNEVPEELQNSKDYVEEIEDNYWIVIYNMQRS